MSAHQAQRTTEAPTERDRSIGRRLREARTDAGLTMTQAAARSFSGSASTLSRLERGERHINPHELSELARIYGVTEDDLTTTLPASDRPHRNSTPEQRAHLRARLGHLLIDLEATGELLALAGYTEARDRLRAAEIDTRTAAAYL